MYAIPSSRTIDWSYCGIPGGIPVRETVYDPHSYGDGTTLHSGDMSSANINTAISDCPSGQVVVLPTGAYTGINIDIGSKASATLRGQGPRNGSAGTKLTCSSGGNVIVSDEVYFPSFTGGEAGFANPHIHLDSGYTKGSTSVVLSADPTADYNVGNLMQICQIDDNVLVFRRFSQWKGNTNLRFTCRITGLSGTGNRTIAFTPPLPCDFAAGQTPTTYILPGGPGPSLFGVESMTLDANGGDGADIYGADRCWFKKVEVTNGGINDGHIIWHDSSQCEMRTNYIHHASGWPTESEGYGTYLWYGCSSFLIEDNIGYRTAMAVLMTSASGCAVTFNHFYELGRASTTWTVAGMHCNHGAHSIMNLWEGNSTERFQNDGYHGSGSHQTLFRNNIHGYNPSKTYERQLVDLAKASYYHNIVGNILGAASWNADYYDGAAEMGHDEGAIYTLGFPNADNSHCDPEDDETPFANWPDSPAVWPDPRVASTLIRHANFDYYNDATQWSDADHDIPNSLLYSSKPSWFGALAWPPIGPDVGGYVTSTPAKARWDAYVISGDIDDLFADQPEGSDIDLPVSGVLGTGTIGAVSTGRVVTLSGRFAPG